MSPYDDLERDLHSLSRSLDVQAGPRLSDAVQERISGLSPPTPSRVRRSWQLIARAGHAWRRRIATVVVAVLVALAATPPVRATVTDWFGFAGVVVEKGPDLGDEAPPPPEVKPTTSLESAAEQVGFAPLVPAELGPPHAVEVSDDHVMVSLAWSTGAGPVRLDEFDGSLDYTIAKTSPGVTFANVAGTDALWFERPHEVVVLDEHGNRREESARLAGHTLIWPVGDLTLRLEGDLTLDRAVEIAESVAPPGG